MASKYQLHVTTWKHCTQCPLCETRKNVVLARGQVPADVLFIGEAPGNSEDALGKPFIGPAGKLLDHIIERAVELCANRPTMAFTNLVACMPKEWKDHLGKVKIEPQEEHIKACSDRLNEFVRLCNPKVIILVGSLAQQHFVGNVDQHIAARIDSKELHVDSIVHPAAILRADISQKSLAIQKCVVTISDAVAGL